jgi:hypothetical protein
MSNQNRPELHTRMPAITAALGAGWNWEARTYDDRIEPKSADLTAPEGMEFYLREDGYRHPGRIEIGLTWPRDARGNVCVPSKYGDDSGVTTSITIVSSKTDTQIAREIIRRLYGPALPVWQKQKASADDSNAWMNRGRVWAEQIAAVFGSVARPSNGGYGYHDTQPATEYRVRLDHLPVLSVKVTGSGISFDVRTNRPELAIDVLKALEIAATRYREAED